MAKIKWGGVTIRERRIYSLVYADDVVIMADKKDELRSMIERLENYLERKKLD